MREVVRFNPFYPLDSEVGVIIQKRFIDLINDSQKEIVLEVVGSGEYVDSENQMLIYGESYEEGCPIDTGVDMAIVTFGSSRLNDYPELAFFTEQLFGPNTDTILQWLYNGGGLNLLNEFLKPMNLYAIPTAMLYPGAFGWSNLLLAEPSQINGLTVRAFGAMGAVFELMGATALDIPGPTVPPLIANGEIDFAVWHNLVQDTTFGFADVAQYIYYPPWQQQTSFSYVVIKLDLWKSFTEHTRDVIISACYSGLTESYTLQLRDNILLLQQYNIARRTIEWSPALMSSFRKNAQIITENNIDTNVRYAKTRASLAEFKVLYDNYNNQAIINIFVNAFVGGLDAHTDLVISIYYPVEKFRWTVDEIPEFIRGWAFLEKYLYVATLPEDAHLLSDDYIDRVTGFVLPFPKIPDTYNAFRKSLLELGEMILGSFVIRTGRTVVWTSNNDVAKTIFQDAPPTATVQPRKPLSTYFNSYIWKLRTPGEYDQIVNAISSNNINIEGLLYDRRRSLLHIIILSDFRYAVLQVIPYAPDRLSLGSIVSDNQTIVICEYPKKFNIIVLSARGENLVFGSEFLENVDLIIAVPE